MDRGARLFTFLGNASRYLAAHQTDSTVGQNDPLYEMLAQNLPLLRSLTEYLQHAATYANDFAFLPNEIINDVVIFTRENRVAESHIPDDYRGLIDCTGSWGDFARESTFLTARVQGGELNVVSKSYKSGQLQEEQISLKDAQSQPICHTVIDKQVNPEQLSAIAPNLHGSIVLETSYIPENVFESLGARFTNIRIDFALFSSGALFLKRQLKSSYLKGLHVGMYPKYKDFEAFLIEFVSKPSFERLSVECEISCPVIEALLQTWVSNDCVESGRQELSGYISAQTVRRLEELLKAPLFQFYASRKTTTRAPCTVRRRHPLLVHAKMELQVSTGFVNYHVSLCFWSSGMGAEAAEEQWEPFDDSNTDGSEQSNESMDVK